MIRREKGSTGIGHNLSNIVIINCTYSYSETIQNRRIYRMIRMYHKYEAPRLYKHYNTVYK